MPAPLRICVITSSYPRWADDHAVPWMHETHRRLVQRGHTVDVLAPSWRGLGDHQIDGVRVHRFRYAPRRLETLTHEQGAPNRIRNPLFQLLAPLYVGAGRRRARALVAGRDYDVIHAHWPLPHAALAFASRERSGIPVITNCHGAELALARRKGWLQPWLRKALCRSDAIVCNSSHTAGAVRDLSGCESHVIPYGSTVRAGMRGTETRTVPRILFTGRLIRRKGVEYLIRAMQRVLQQRRCELVITGDGDCRTELEHLARDLDLGSHVQFLGFVTADELERLYSCSDVYVLPAVVDDTGDAEGLGVGPIEAFQHGLPVVATAVGGIVDVVQHGQTGVVVPEKDPEALAEGILEMLGDRDRAAQLAANGLELVMRKFEWEGILDRLEILYAQVADRRSTNAAASVTSGGRKRGRRAA